MIKLIVSHYFSLLGNNENKDYPASNQYLDCTLLNVMNDIFGQKNRILLLVSFIIYFLHVNFLLCQNLLPSNRPITYITLPAKFTIILSWLKILITKSIWLFLQLHSLSSLHNQNQVYIYTTYISNTFTVSLSFHIYVTVKERRAGTTICTHTTLIENLKGCSDLFESTPSQQSNLLIMW